MKKKTSWIRVWRKIKTSVEDLLRENYVHPIDVVKVNRKTGFVTWLDLR